jgi:uncharacterized protein YjcR
MQCIQVDSSGLSILNWLWESKKTQAKPLCLTTSVESVQKNWVLETNLRKNSEKLNQPSIVALNHQSGVLRRTEKIESKKLIRFFIKHNPVGGKLTLTTTFIGQDRNLVRSQHVNESEESLTVLSPQWAEQAEFSVHFENAIDLKAIEISQLIP